MLRQDKQRRVLEFQEVVLEALELVIRCSATPRIRRLVESSAELLVPVCSPLSTRLPRRPASVPRPVLPLSARPVEAASVKVVLLPSEDSEPLEAPQAPLQEPMELPLKRSKKPMPLNRGVII